MTRSPSIVRPALAIFSVRLLLQQIALALLVFALSIIWLRIPDASAIDVAGSVFLALLTLAIAGAGESILILRLANRQRTALKLVRGAIFLLLAVALWFACSALLDHLQVNDRLRAGYLNSRFPHSMRNLFSYQHILLWLGWVWTLIQAICTGVIALVGVNLAASSSPQRAIKHSLHSLAFWIVVAVGIPCATALTNALTQWTPGHGLRVETLSLLFRLTFAVLVDATLMCLLLAILAECVRQSDPLYATPTGTPNESQPRTVDNP